jgi:hypothetical protein
VICSREVNGCDARLIIVQAHDAKVSLILDAWTSSNGYAFLAIVARYITKDFELGEFVICSFLHHRLTLTVEEVLLDFQEIQGEHSGENLAHIVWNTIELYGLVNKVRLY